MNFILLALYMQSKICLPTHYVSCERLASILSHFVRCMCLRWMQFQIWGSLNKVAAHAGTVLRRMMNIYKGHCRNEMKSNIQSCRRNDGSSGFVTWWKWVAPVTTFIRNDSRRSNGIWGGCKHRRRPIVSVIRVCMVGGVG